jgi:hypothetical protein
VGSEWDKEKFRKLLLEKAVFDAFRKRAVSLGRHEVEPRDDSSLMVELRVSASLQNHSLWKVIVLSGSNVGVIKFGCIGETLRKETIPRELRH